MKNRPFLRRAVLASAIATAFCPVSVFAQDMDYSFQFPTGSNPPYALQSTGLWSQAAQWGGGQLPGQTDVLKVTLPQTYQYLNESGETVTDTLTAAELNHDSGDNVIHSISADNQAGLRLGGGTLTLQNNSTLNAAFVQNGGQLAGSGGLTVNGTATLDGGTMSGTGTTTLNGAGTVLWGIGLDGGRVLDNKSNLNFLYDYNSIYSNDGTGRFDNHGTVSKSGGNVVSTIDVTFNNSGSVDVQSGALRLSGGGTHSGSFGGPGVVEFNGGTNLLQSGVSFNNIGLAGTLSSPSVDYSIAGTSTYYGGRMSGAGTTTLKGLATDIYGLDLTGGRALELSKGNTFDFQGAYSNVSSSDATGTFNNFGTVTKTSGSGVSDIAATFNNGGAVEVAAGGIIRLAADGTHSGSFGGDGVVEFSSGTHTLLNGVSLNNIGLGGTLASSVDYSIQGTSTYYGGIMTGAGKTVLNGPSTVIYGLGLGGGRVLDNQSAMNFKGDYNNIYVAEGGGSFDNHGTIVKSEGTNSSSIYTQFNNYGSVEVQTGALRLAGGGTHSGSFGGDGVVEFTGGTHTLLASASLQNIALSGGSLNSSDDYAIAGTAAFYDGKMTGAGRTILNGASSVEYYLGLESGRVLENRNVLDFKRDNNSIYGEGSVDNAGTVRKSGGTGYSYIDAHFSNTGTVDVQTGTLDLLGHAANFRNDGIVHTDTGAVLMAGSIDNTANGIITGTGTVALNGGTLTNEGQINPGNSPGTLTLDGNLVLTSTGNLNIELAGLNNYDKFIVTGQAILGGSLNLYALNGYRPNLGDSFDFLLFGSVSGSFDRVNLFGFDPGLSANLAFWGDHVQLSFIGSPNNNSPIPEPSTIWLVIGGWVAWMASRRGLVAGA